MSPRKKRCRKASPRKGKPMKRESDPEEVARKRLKSVSNEEDELKARKKKNFIEACKRVSCKAYFDYRIRLLVDYLPSCLKTSVCKHHNKDGVSNIKKMPSYAEESFKIEMKSNVWYEALEVCQICISPSQYLSDNVLRDVVEIMLNAHEDDYADHSVENIIDRCQQILSLNFSTHPPCFIKSLRNCYKNFLTGPMDSKENTFTNRTQFEYKKGIVKYCINRLEYEISIDSEDGPIINKYEHIPEELKQTVQGLHWQKEKFEIFELLHRPERIERLIAVLESVVEIFQFDFVIWHLRFKDHLGVHVMRSHRPLMAFILWPDNQLYTGAVTYNCKQIMKLFVQMVHLQYPDSMLRIITMWLNTMIQMFYICESNSNRDYPNTGSFCLKFANVFYHLISEMPNDSVLRILEKIEPSYMRHLIGIIHLKNILQTNENCIINILINFIKTSQWTEFPKDDSKINFSKKLFTKPKKIKNVLKYVLKTLDDLNLEDDIAEKSYAKIDKEQLKRIMESGDTVITVNHVIFTLYVTLEAYLDTYDIMCVQETWDTLNEQMLDENQQPEEFLLKHSSYNVTEALVTKFKYIHQKIKELGIVFLDLRSDGEIPEVLNVFRNIGSLEF